MDRDDVAFPDAEEIPPHALAFARMMFAHAAFERELRLLVDAINPKETGFGERRENQWTASGRLSKSEIFWTRLFNFAGSAIFSLTAHGGVSTAGP
jgi:hypothetical protein